MLMTRFFFVLVLGLLISKCAFATTFYVKCSATGLSTGTKKHPFRSLDTVNSKLFSAGDTISFARSNTCRGQLHPQGSGAKGAPIRIDAYGRGRRPLIAGHGTVYATVFLYDQEYWEIRNLEITNQGESAAERNGLLVELHDFGVGHSYLVDHVYVHEVNGADDQTKLSNGIQFRVTGTKVPTRFDDVRIQNNEVEHIDREGITTASEQNCRPIYGCPGLSNWYPSINVIFRNNRIHDIGGDGIVVRVSDHALIERNEAFDLNMRSKYNNAGIWTINSDDTAIQQNEVYRVRRRPGQTDGMAFDSDFGNIRALFQQNYSHNNEGGFMLFCGACGSGSLSTGTIVRYNISQNDGSRILYAVGEQSSEFYNNTIYIAAGLNTRVIQDDTGKTRVHFVDNIFLNYGTGAYGGTHYVPPNYLWTRNLFYGQPSFAQLPKDVDMILANPYLRAAGQGSVGLKSASVYALTSKSSLPKGSTIFSSGFLQDYFGTKITAECRPGIGAIQRMPCRK